MSFKPAETLAVFIDGSNLYATARMIGLEIDYEKLKKFFNDQATVLRFAYYTAVPENKEFTSIVPLLDWLEYNGYRVVTKPLKRFEDGKLKGNMDIELALDAVNIAAFVDHIVIFSGDGDFKALVSDLQSKGKRVTIISTMKTDHPMIADILRRQADQFLDLANIREHLQSDERERPRRNKQQSNKPAPVAEPIRPDTVTSTNADEDFEEDEPLPPEEEMPFYISIRDVGLDPAIVECLISEDIFCVGELVEHKPVLERIDGIGKVRAGIIRDCLNLFLSKELIEDFANTEFASLSEPERKKFFNDPDVKEEVADVMKKIASRLAANVDPVTA